MSRRGQFIRPSLVVVDLLPALLLLLLQSHVRVTVLSVFTAEPAHGIHLAGYLSVGLIG